MGIIRLFWFRRICAFADGIGMCPEGVAFADMSLYYVVAVAGSVWGG